MSDLPQVLFGKTALVTGASRGLGRAIVLDLASRGAEVWGVGRDATALEETARGAASLGGKFHSVVADLRDEKTVVDLISRIPQLDIVINNAGIAAISPILETNAQSFIDMLGINVVAPFIVLRESIRKMKDQPGLIIDVASDAALHGISNMATYCASKHALLGLDRAVREELKGTQIRLTTICPGPIKTEILGAISNSDQAMNPSSVAKAIGDVASLPTGMIIPEIILQPGSNL